MIKSPGHSTLRVRAGGGAQQLEIVLDASAINARETLHEKLRHRKKHLILSGPHTQRYFLMEKAGFLERVGAGNVVGDLAAAVARARELVGG